MIDFIHLSFADPPLDLSPLLAAYPDRNLVADRFGQHLHLHRLEFLLGCVAHTQAAADVDVDKTPNAAAHLRQSLNILMNGAAN
ncbi:MAG: hypothetical protein GKR89_36040 [Candidatus Latescibacteria bacterium]|nr:hypothetical protein [Candidatus Latescibacterota bacterium]